MKRLIFIMAATLVGAGTVLAGDIIVPVAALNAPGAYGNLWSTEVYAINPTGQTLQVEAPRRALPLRVTWGGGPDQCPAGPIGPLSVPAHSSVVIPPSWLDFIMGCPSVYVGGLVFSADAGIVIQTRMVNHKAFGPDLGLGLLAGFGADIPGLPASDIPSPQLSYLLATLVWDTGSGPPAFDTYLYFANPTVSDATVTLTASAGGQPVALRIGGSEVGQPYSVTVPANSEVQLHPQPLTAGSGGPTLFDLAFSVTAPVAVIGTVVDRASNDSRVVLPVPIPGTT